MFQEQLSHLRSGGRPDRCGWQPDFNLSLCMNQTHSIFKYFTIQVKLTHVSLGSE